MIVPYPAGGGTDVLGRLVARKLSDTWGQPVIVDNRPGGNSVIGTDALAKSAPDGYTIMAMAIAFAITPTLLPTPYDPIKDFAPVGMVYGSEFVLVINPGLPTNNLQELIALASAKPGQLNYATTGAGGSSHLANVLLGMLTGVQIQHIPYKGAGPALVDVIGGQVQMFMNNPLTVIGPIKSGRVRGIAVTGAARVPALPQVPTFAEGGVPGVDVSPWFCLLAPAGSPMAITNKVSAKVGKVMALPDVLDYLAKQDEPRYIHAGATGCKDEGRHGALGKPVRAAKIKIDI